MPQYNVSRLVDRLEASGYAVRRPHPQDGRGQVLQITDAGTDLIKRMWNVYGRAITAKFALKLERGEAGKLSELLQRLL